MADSAAAVFGSYSPSLPQFEVIKPKSGKTRDNLSVHKETMNLKPSTSKLSRRQKNPTMRRNRSLNQDSRNDRTVFVGNIPMKCSKKNIKQLFKQYGSIENIRFRSVKVSPGDMPSRLAKRTHKQLIEGSSFNAYVVMASSDEAESCLNLNGTMLQGRHLRIDMIAKKKSEAENCRSIFVGNLPFSADEEKLREVFALCGEIEDIRIIRDSKTGIGKGFGFVTFKDKSSVIFALKQNNKAVLDTRCLRVHRSKDQDTLQKDKQSKISGLKCSSIAGRGSTKVQKVMGKRRPDGTKNRYYRI